NAVFHVHIKPLFSQEVLKDGGERRIIFYQQNFGHVSVIKCKRCHRISNGQSPLLFHASLFVLCKDTTDSSTYALENRCSRNILILVQRIAAPSARKNQKTIVLGVHFSQFLGYAVKRMTVGYFALPRRDKHDEIIILYKRT